MIINNEAPNEIVSSPKTWLLMFYFAGDNDLGEDMAEKLCELKTIFDGAAAKPRTKYIKLMAYFDGNNPFITTSTFDLTRDALAIPVSTIAARNSANKWTVKRFVEWCVETSGHGGADNYGLIFSGHGDGFQQTGFLRDASSSNFMTVTKLQEVIQDINLTVLKKRKLNLIGFDSCVMNMIEVANEFKEVAEMMVASEGYMPTTGMGYGELVQSLIELDKNAASREITNDDVAKAFVEAATEKNREMSALTKQSLDMSVLDLTKIEPVIDGIFNLAKLLKRALPGTADEPEFYVREALGKAILFGQWKSQSFLFDQSVDIADFCEQLRTECLKVAWEVSFVSQLAGVKLIEKANFDSPLTDIKISAELSNEDKIKYAPALEVLSIFNDIAGQCTQVQQAVSNFVVKCCFSGPDYQFAKGTSVFFPWSNIAFVLASKEFSEFDFIGTGTGNAFKYKPWYEFLHHYLAMTTRVSKLALKTNNLTNERYTFLQDVSLTLEFGNGQKVLLDPPPKGMLGADGKYKEYFMRFKNFPLDDVNDCAKD